MLLVLYDYEPHAPASRHISLALFRLALACTLYPKPSSQPTLEYFIWSWKRYLGTSICCRNARLRVLAGTWVPEYLHIRTRLAMHISLSCTLSFTWHFTNSLSLIETTFIHNKLSLSSLPVDRLSHPITAWDAFVFRRHLPRRPSPHGRPVESSMAPSRSSSQPPQVAPRTTGSKSKRYRLYLCRHPAHWRLPAYWCIRPWLYRNPKEGGWEEEEGGSSSTCCWCYGFPYFLRLEVMPLSPGTSSHVLPQGSEQYANVILPRQHLHHPFSALQPPISPSNHSLRQKHHIDEFFSLHIYIRCSWHVIARPTLQPGRVEAAGLTSHILLLMGVSGTLVVNITLDTNGTLLKRAWSIQNVQWLTSECIHHQQWWILRTRAFTCAPNQPSLATHALD